MDRSTRSIAHRRSTRGQTLARTAFGLAVLAAIVGGLFAYERLSADGDGGDTLIETQPEDILVPADPDVGALDQRAPRIGEAAPQFALRSPDGAVDSLHAHHGQVVWVNFWATWCEPCKRELPDIQKLYHQLAGDGLVVLTVNLQEDSDQATAFFEERELDMPILLDRSGDVYEQYQLRGLPDSFFIDRDGVLRAMQIGFLTENQMREKLAEVGIES
jgi:peroxiredoxin